MADLQTLAAKIEADRAEVESLAGPINSSKGQAEHAASAIGALGAESASVRVRNVIDKIEEAESIRASLQGALVKARFMVVSAMHGRMGPGAPGSGAIVPLKRVDAQTGAPKSGLDAMPSHLRQDPTPSGEALSGIDPTIGPFQKEHENAGADSKMNRLARAGRLGVRNVEDLKAGGQQVVSGSNADIDSFDAPPPGGYNTTTQVPEHIPQIHSVHAPQPSATDIVGSAIVVAVVIAESAGRLIERRKRRHDGG